MLYLIGIGLHDEKDITLKGLEAVRNSAFVYLESYTSKLACSVEKMEELYGKKVILADREMIEKRVEKEILLKAKDKDVCLLIIGDVFGATTHIDLMMRAKELEVPVNVIHNASVLTAVGATGLSLYKFGKVTSVSFENENVETPYNVLKANSGMHTLFLLDLKPEEKQYMTANEAIRYLLGVEERRREGFFTRDTKCVICAGLGGEDAIIKYGKACELVQETESKFPQCLIVPGDLHFMEEEFLEKL
jgi:diphthine synthase